MIQLKTASVERKESAISTMLSGIEDYVYQYSKNSRVEEMIQADTRNAMKIGMFLDQWKSLPSYASFNEATRNYVLKTMTFFTNSGVIITNLSTYITKKWTNEYLINGYTTKEWISVLDATKGSTLFKLDAKNADTDTALIYRANLPVGNSDLTHTVMLLYLDKNKLEKQLLSDFHYDGAAAYVLNREGQLILSSGLEKDPPLTDFADQANTFSYTYQGMAMTVFHIQSIYNGWTYVWLLPSNQVNSELNYIIYMVAVILILLIIAGFFITIAMSKQQNQPVKEIANMLIPETTGKTKDTQHINEFDLIKGNIREMMKQEKSLQGQLMQNKDLVKSAMLDKLLNGRFTDLQSIENALRQIQFPLTGNGYTMVIIQIIDDGLHPDTVSNIQIQHSILLSFINSKFSELWIHSVSYQRMAIFYHLNSNDSEPPKEFAARLKAFLTEKGHTNVMISVGDTCAEISGISMSYKSAVFALTKAETNNGVIYSEAPGSETSSTFYYPIDVEQRIISLVSVGDSAGTQVLLEQLFKQNTARYEHRYDLVGVFITELVGTLFKILSAEDMDQCLELKSLTTLMTRQDDAVDESFQIVLEQYRILCAFIKQKRRSSTNILIESIIKYVDSFYMDQNLSLSKLADKFNLSEPYLSHLFKESTGENLSSCLERIRINNAHSLLTETNLSIDDIAEKVGYCSSDTFRKAFKRYHGITPAMYRSSTK
ncbi:MAG: helix-turn-helix domain-containing protein [Clostridiaceae bacterium]|nr:helix-turn-helix domain-containing protein [Clostridiaceae bacterium]